MANNKIQIKRSVANSTVTGLSNGELAYTQSSNTLWIGLPDGSGVAAIGGVRYPGVLTANQALVANSSSGLDRIIVANAIVTTVTANGSVGTNGQVLVTNGTAVYWGTGTSGANTNIQFNDSGVANGVAGFTFDKTSNTLFVGNTVQANNLTLANVFVGNSTNYVASNSTGVWVTGTVNATTFQIGSNFTANSSLVNAAAVNVQNQIDTATIYATTSANIASAVQANASGLWTTGTVNASIHAIGSTFVANSSGVYHTGTMNSASYSIGSSLTANSLGVYHTGTVNAAVVSIGTSTISNSTGVFTTGQVNGQLVSVGSAFTANSTLVNAVAINVVNQVNTTTIYATTSANIASAVQANSTGVWTTGRVNAASLTVGTSTVANATGVYTGVVNATTVQVGSAFTANATAIQFTGANVDATAAVLNIRDAVVSGNLTVSGTVTTIDATNLTINDPIFELARNNTTTDAVDSGIFSPAGNSTAVWYSGIARIAALSSNSNPLYRIFGTSVNPNTSTIIDTTASTLTGTLQAYLAPYGVGSTGFIANSTAIRVTANSTLSVQIVANTLSLTTALAGTSGGTGLNTYTQEDILVANSSNGFRKLSLGTSGYVLQSNGTALLYDVLDGGSF